MSQVANLENQTNDKNAVLLKLNKKDTALNYIMSGQNIANEN